MDKPVHQPWCPFHHQMGPLHQLPSVPCIIPLVTPPSTPSSPLSSPLVSPPSLWLWFRSCWCRGSGSLSRCPLALHGPARAALPEGPGAGRTGAWGLCWGPGRDPLCRVLGLFPTPRCTGCICAVLPGAVLARSFLAHREAPAGATGRGTLCRPTCPPTSLPHRPAQAPCAPRLSPCDAASAIVPCLGHGDTAWRCHRAATTGALAWPG